MRRGQQPWRNNRARALRSTQTSAEERLWAELRARRLKGLKFVRQIPIGPYFADFVCRERQIVVEIDGATHGSDTELDRDDMRTAFLAANGYRVFRANNAEVFSNMPGVLDSLIVFAGVTERE